MQILALVKRPSILIGIGFVVIIGAAVAAYRYFYFPQVHDWNSVRITLERTQCFGSCPDYKIEIRGDGTVTYTGLEYVAIPGQHHGRVSPTTVHQLVDAFRSARYFHLHDVYASRINDYPTYRTSITFDGIHKSVLDYAGERASPPMPSTVTELEETIDRLAGTQKWLCGNAETVPNLVAEGWDFKSPEAAHASVLARVAICGDARSVQDLVAASAPLETRYVETGMTALVTAARGGNIEMVRVLLEAGAGSSDPSEKGEALKWAAERGKLDIVQLLLKFGAKNPEGSLQK